MMVKRRKLLILLVAVIFVALFFLGRLEKQSYYDLKTLNKKQTYYVCGLQCYSSVEGNSISEILEKLGISYGDEEYVFYSNKQWNFKGRMFVDGKYARAISQFLFYAKAISTSNKPLEFQKAKIREGLILLRNNDSKGIQSLLEQFVANRQGGMATPKG